MIKIHPRHFTVKDAELKLSGFINKLVEEHDLTFAEILSIMNDAERRWIGFAVRDERETESKVPGETHGIKSRPGLIACLTCGHVFGSKTADKKTCPSCDRQGPPPDAEPIYDEEGRWWYRT